MGFDYLSLESSLESSSSFPDQLKIRNHRPKTVVNILRSELAD